MNCVHLKSATLADLLTIKRLLSENQLPFADIQDKLEGMFLLEKNCQLVGIGGIEQHQPYGLLRSLVIVNSFRGQGLGKTACRQLITQACALNLEELYLLTTTATSFFTKLGFTEISRNSVPPAIQKTSQFSCLCPSIAVCLHKKL